jgi:hypothetical protein
MPYVYRHIRLDKNEPFYIGIGSDSDYSRAYCIQKRNNIWNKIVTKSDYEVEILLDNITWDQACIKEKEFINLYGRKDLNTGILSNLTDGGEGVYGLKFTDEAKNKMSIAQKNKKPISEQTRNRMSIASKSRNVGAYRIGKKHSKETKEKMRLSRIGVKKAKLICPHCKLEGRGGAMKQWHFDKCKYK